MSEQSSKTEWHFQGATMHAVQTDAHVGISYPCIGCYDFGIFHMVRICTHSAGHGHIVIACDDGTAVIPVAIYSLPFLHVVLQHLAARRTLNTHECNKLTEVAKPLLAKEMTLYEQEIARSEYELERVTECAFYSI
jgi:hypothetical protein